MSADRNPKTGAGVIPFCENDGRVLFLFHKTFSGARAGCLVDFGGGAHPGENHKQTAIREFIEETEALYFSKDIHLESTPEGIQAQTTALEALFDATLRPHPNWWCRRKAGSKSRPRDWITFFIKFKYRDVTEMNKEWQRDRGRRFLKRRELVWVSADTLQGLYDDSPGTLWKRVRQLVNAQEMIHMIQDQLL